MYSNICEVSDNTVVDFIGTTYFPPNIQHFNIMEYLHKSTDNLPLQSSCKTLH